MPRAKDDFDNGEEYFRQGNTIWLPENSDLKPKREFLEWHSATGFCD